MILIRHWMTEKYHKRKRTTFFFYSVGCCSGDAKPPSICFTLLVRVAAAFCDAKLTWRQQADCEPLTVPASTCWFNNESSFSYFFHADIKLSLCLRAEGPGSLRLVAFATVRAAFVEDVVWCVCVYLCAVFTCWRLAHWKKTGSDF